ncbi:MAG: F0F1 ATP synthase subunit epsilon [Acidimicrobiales bacterium]
MSFQVEFVSPEDILYSGVGTMVVARTRGGGDIAFLTGHEPFIGSLLPSEVRVTEDGGNVQRFVVRGGFVSGDAQRSAVLSDEATAVDDIDVAAVEAERSAAQAALAANADDMLAADDLAWPSSDRRRFRRNRRPLTPTR